MASIKAAGKVRAERVGELENAIGIRIFKSGEDSPVKEIGGGLDFVGPRWGAGESQLELAIENGERRKGLGRRSIRGGHNETSGVAVVVLVTFINHAGGIGVEAQGMGAGREFAQVVIENVSVKISL